MPSRKPRVLLVNEASFLASGYSTYGNEVMRRLHAAGKYELAELACYGSPEDPRRYDLPWAYFPNMPPQGHEEEWSAYHSREANQWGEWTFNDVVLRFRPDVVWDVRDPWMMAFEETSPHRRHYYHAYMPTVDAEPQQEQWLSTYAAADAVLTYTDWGRGVLAREGGGLIELRGSAPPGGDLDTFRPMHKADLRSKFGFEDNINVVGTVMRNNPRKLYPQLIRDFAAFLGAAEPDVARRTFLYLHVSYPDNAWDIPKLIKQSGISRKILVTYRCRACEVVFPALFQDARGVCVKCGRATATLPNVEHPVGRDTLAMIINLFDVYVQYAQNEGLGMPQVEAAACGVPVMAVDYSGMSDVVRKVNGYPIAVSHYDVEPGSERLLARPDDKDFVRLLRWFFSLPDGRRREAAFRARQGAERNYTWDACAAKWAEVFDSFPQRPPAETWDSPPRVHRSRLPLPPEFPSNEAFVAWAITNVLGRPELRNSYLALRLIRDLNWGRTNQSAGVAYASEDSVLGRQRRSRPFGVGEAMEELAAMREFCNEWEAKRCHEKTWTS